MRLEKQLLSLSYSLREPNKFGWREVDFLVATKGGKTGQVANELRKRDEVVFLGKCIGQHTIDLKVETVLKGNSEILQMQELLKSMDGVSEVMWTEIVEVIMRKSPIPTRIIDEL